MKTKREALADAGLAIAGARGKFSTAANEQLDKWRSEGIKFSDDNTVKTVVKEKKSPAEPKVDKYPEYITPSDYRYPEEEYRAFTREGGKKVMLGMRECCSTCGYSLLNHPCDTPTKYGKVVVIEAKKGVAA